MGIRQLKVNLKHPKWVGHVSFCSPYQCETPWKTAEIFQQDKHWTLLDVSLPFLTPTKINPKHFSFFHVQEGACGILWNSLGASCRRMAPGGGDRVASWLRRRGDQQVHWAAKRMAFLLKGTVTAVFYGVLQWKEQKISDVLRFSEQEDMGCAVICCLGRMFGCVRTLES